MPDDTAQNILSPVQVDNSIKASAWDAFNSSKNENELGVRLQGIQLPQNIKAQLWDAKKSSGGTGVPDLGPLKAMMAPQPVTKFPGTDIPASPSRIPASMTGKPGEGYQYSDLANPLRGAGMAIGGATGGIPGAALGGAAGEATNQLIQRAAGQPVTPDPGTEIGKQAALGALYETGGKYVLAPLMKWGGRQIARLAGETPERIAWLQKYFPAKEAVESKVAQAEVASRTAFKQAYNDLGINAAPVNLQNTRTVASQAADQLKAYGVPRPVSQVANIPLPTEAQVARQIAPETMHPEEILERLGKYDNVPFREAQQYRTAIEQYISKTKPPAAVYNALKNVSNSLKSGIAETAAREGKLPGLQNADAMFETHAADFWNKGAPLKPFVNANPSSKQAVLNKFLQTAKDARALSALERRGVDTTELRELMAKGSAKDVRDAATMKNLGQPVLNQQVGQANTAAVKKLAVKTAIGATGVGGLAELVRWLATQPRKPQ